MLDDGMHIYVILFLYLGLIIAQHPCSLAWKSEQVARAATLAALAGIRVPPVPINTPALGQIPSPHIKSSKLFTATAQ
jgi:hypothetical protein